MSWILFSVLSALFFAITNTFDKFLLTKWVKRPVVPLMMFGIVGIVASLAIYLIRGFSQLSLFHISLAFVAGTLYMLMTWFYFKAVQLEEISRVVPLFYLSPLLILLLAFAFLGEVFSPIKYLGIFLLIIGAVLISFKKSLKMGKAFWLMMASCLSLAASQVLIKYLYGFSEFWTIFAYVHIGSFISLVPVFIVSYSALKETVKESGFKALGLSISSETINVVGSFLGTLALATGYVTLVNALSSVQPFFLLAITIVLSLFYPKILKEELGGSTVLLKFVAIAMMFIGSLLVV